MHLSKPEILTLIKEWLVAWDEYNLEKVMALMHEDVVFDNWTGAIVIGKDNLKRSWIPWFSNHGNFKFIVEDIFVDEQEQKVLFRWRLHWHSHEKKYKGQNEIRRGVDVIHFVDGKIHEKFTYSKTTIQIDLKQIPLLAQ